MPDKKTPVKPKEIRNDLRRDLEEYHDSVFVDSAELPAIKSTPRERRQQAYAELEDDWRNEPILKKKPAPILKDSLEPDHLTK